MKLFSLLVLALAIGSCSEPKALDVSAFGQALGECTSACEQISGKLTGMNSKVKDMFKSEITCICFVNGVAVKRDIKMEKPQPRK